MRKWLLSFDVLAIMVFVIVGRSNHGSEQSIGGVLSTAAPFLLAVVFGWVLVRAWLDPASLRVGVEMVGVTVVVGMVLRRSAFGDGTEPSFVLVTAAFLTLFMVGWRLVVLLSDRRHPVGA
ncbi:MAG: DUF3054 domain-containing protein [Acidimicrobiia bacterium]|nr:DUF3054 domain-containing protein [Acidimicrobiia bacterium]